VPCQLPFLAQGPSVRRFANMLTSHEDD